MTECCTKVVNCCCQVNHCINVNSCADTATSAFMVGVVIGIVLIALAALLYHVLDY